MRLLWLIALGLLAGGAILWAALLEPPWLLPDTHGLSPVDRVKARTDLRNTLVTTLGGLAVLTGGVVAAGNLVLSQRVQWRAQVTERFSKAIEQLGQRGDDKLDVRIGAAYALEQIARDSAELHWPIMEVLTAYLREHAQVRRAPVKAADDAPHKRLPADHQAIATVIGRRHWSQIQKVSAWICTRRTSGAFTGRRHTWRGRASTTRTWRGRISSGRTWRGRTSARRRA